MRFIIAFIIALPSFAFAAEQSQPDAGMQLLFEMNMRYIQAAREAANQKDRADRAEARLITLEKANGIKK